MRILVADDHSLFRDGITSLLEAAGHEVVGQVSNGEAAVSESLHLKPDLVLMDISLPKINGIEALRQIKENAATVKVVMLTVSEEEEDLVESIKSKADGYLLKSLTAEEFLASLHGLERGELALSRTTFAEVIQGLVDPSEKQDAPPEPLTPRELEILHLVAQGQSNKSIAVDLSVSVNTVKYHMKKILQKLSAKNRTEAVIHAVRVGWIEAGDFPTEKR